tara:strand:+ start:881 stop:1021 length:141 start_codon:yes stop_codon:yes gene_type:complete
MIPEFFQTPEHLNHFGLWKTILGLLIVFLGTFVGVEIRVGNDDEDI